MERSPHWSLDCLSLWSSPLQLSLSWSLNSEKGSKEEEVVQAEEIKVRERIKDYRVNLSVSTDFFMSILYF